MLFVGVGFVCVCYVYLFIIIAGGGVSLLLFVPCFLLGGGVFGVWGLWHALCVASFFSCFFLQFLWGWLQFALVGLLPLLLLLFLGGEGGVHQPSISSSPAFFLWEGSVGFPKKLIRKVSPTFP